MMPFAPRFARESASSLPVTAAWAGTQRRDVAVRVRRDETARRVSATCFLLALHFLTLSALSIVYLLSLNTKTGGREDGARTERMLKQEITEELEGYKFGYIVGGVPEAD